MSQNSTLTCFISPGSAGRAAGTRPDASSGAPHWPQNRFSGGLAAPHDGHPEASGAPHWPQNLMPAGLSAWHREHLIAVAPGRRVNANVKASPKLSPGQLYLAAGSTLRNRVADPAVTPRKISLGDAAEREYRSLRPLPPSRARRGSGRDGGGRRILRPRQGQIFFS